MTSITTDRVKVLLVDDEIQIRRLLRAFLERNGFHVIEAATAEEGIDEAIRCNPQLVLLDLGLPDGDGMEVLKRLREWSQAPILVISVRGDEDDKISALEGGADDFITKPFSTGEVLARLRVALRHIHPHQSVTDFRSGQLHVDLALRMVKIGGRNVRLSATEYSLLHLFVTHAGKVLTHGHILSKMWGDTRGSKIGQLRVYMAFLRDKLETNPADPELLVTEPGVGYRLVVRG